MAVKSDYRRVFIMLRPLGVDNGAGGFCRVETRSGRGQIVFSAHIDIADGELRALLVAKDAVADCGALRTVRGQGVLACDIERDAYDNRPIDAYLAAVVIYLYNNKPSIALIGALGRERPDIAVIERLLNARYGEKREVRAASLRAARAAVHEVPPAVEAVADPPVITPSPAEAPVSSCEQYPSFSEGTPDDSPSLQQYDTPNTAGDWVGICLDVREQYERGVMVEPFTSMDDVLFKRIPMSADQYGMDHYILGVRYKLGRPEGLCYGVPGSYRSYPPPGLEGYRWRGTSDGKSGYWLSWLDAVTGDPIA